MVQDGSGRFRIVQDGLRRFRNLLGKVRKRQRWVFVVQKEYSGGQLVCIAFIV
jgi:hypothetical protein